MGRAEIAVNNTDRLSAALAGRYRIERELGAGDMATVYLARDVKLPADRFGTAAVFADALTNPASAPIVESAPVGAARETRGGEEVAIAVV